MTTNAPSPELRTGLWVGAVPVTATWVAWFAFMALAGDGWSYRYAVSAVVAVVVGTGLVAAVRGVRPRWGHGVVAGSIVSSALGVLGFWALLLVMSL